MGITLRLVCPCGREWDADIPKRVLFFPSTTCEVCRLKKKIEAVAVNMHAEKIGELWSREPLFSSVKPPDPPDYFADLITAMDAWRKAKEKWPLTKADDDKKSDSRAS